MACVMVGLPHTGVFESAPQEFAGVLKQSCLHCYMRLRSEEPDDESSFENARNYLWFRIFFGAIQVSLAQFTRPHVVDGVAWAWVPGAMRPFSEAYITGIDIEDAQLCVQGMADVFETLALCLDALKAECRSRSTLRRYGLSNQSRLRVQKKRCAATWEWLFF